MNNCSKCGGVKTGSHKIYCTLCKNEMDLDSYHKNKEKRNKYASEWKAKNPEKVKKNNLKIKEWIKNNPGYMNLWNKKQRDSNNIHFKLSHVLRERLRGALKFNSKGKKTLDMLGCSVEEFKMYLESKFLPEMNWENYGRKGWHIDHIIPVSSFDLSKSEEQQKCFHYTNMQPLWWIDNLKKSNKIINEK